MGAVRDAICLHLQGDLGSGGLMEIVTDVYPGAPTDLAEHPLVVVVAHRAPRGSYAFQGLDHEVSQYLVKGVVKGSGTALASEINRRIRARLDGAELVVEGRTTLLASWEQDVEYPETGTGDGEDGTTYHHEGSIYEVWTEPE